MGAPVILDAAPEDGEPIRALMAAAIEYGVTRDPALLAETLANVNRNLDLWLAEPARCLHLKALLDGRLAGVVLVKDGWNLCSLFVAPEAQRAGIGRALFEAAAARCRGRSAKGALWLNAAGNAIPFYERLGCVPRQSAQVLPPGFMPMRRAL